MKQNASLMFILILNIKIVMLLCLHLIRPFKGEICAVEMPRPSS